MTMLLKATMQVMQSCKLHTRPAAGAGCAWTAHPCLVPISTKCYSRVSRRAASIAMTGSSAGAAGSAPSSAIGESCCSTAARMYCISRWHAAPAVTLLCWDVPRDLCPDFCTIIDVHPLPPYLADPLQTSPSRCTPGCPCRCTACLPAVQRQAVHHPPVRQGRYNSSNSQPDGTP